METITYLCGPPGCGKTRAILERYAACAREFGSDSVVLLLPDAATARGVQDALAKQLTGLYDARVMTFPQLARALLRSNRDPLMGLEPAQRALLARRVAMTRTVRLPEALTARRGFIAGLCSFIDELKREAVDPGQFDAAVRQAFRGDERALGLARCYDAYQRELTERNLYDEPGLFWQATHLLRPDAQHPSGRDEPFHAARLILADGFTDFTTTQLQVLGLLTRDREAVISLTLPPDEERAGEFAAAWGLLNRLREHLGDGEVTWLAYCDGRPEPLRRLLDQLFRLRPRSTRVGADVPDAQGAVQVLAAPGVLAEAREILREVKELLLEGVPPDDICLIFRSLDAYRRPLQEVAQETGVPVAVTGHEPLASRPSVQVILDLLQVPLGDYSARDVIKLLKSSFVDLAALKGDNTGTPEELEQAAGEARIIGGRTQWAERLRLYQARLQAERNRAARGQGFAEDADPRDPAQIEGERGRAERAANLFSALTARLDRLERPQSRAEHVRRLLELVHELGLAGRIAAQAAGVASCATGPAVHDATPAACETSANLAAFKEFTSALQQIADADRLLGDAEAIPFADFCREVISLCAETTFELPLPRDGRVMALDAYAARQLRKPYVFVGGLVEGQWPAVRHEQAFFDDRERARLNAAGLRLDLSAEAQHDEAYLFYLACAAAEHRLYLTYPTMDSGGDTLLRSHYVDEVWRLLGKDVLRPRERRLSESVLQPHEVVCLRELLEHAVYRQDEGTLGAVGPDEQALSDHALAMAAIEQQRYSWEPFEAHDGMLRDPQIHQRLARQFDADHKWSASALGQYGNCPFRFFVERVLRLEVLETPSEEVEVKDLGQLAHLALRRFFTDHQTRYPHQPLAGRDLGEALDQMSQCIAGAFEEWERLGLVTHRKLWELARQRLQQDLAAVVAYEFAEVAKSGLVPRAFEAEYDIRVMIEGTGETLRIGGKIDRVDVQPHPGAGGDPPEYVVYDYKSGAGASPKAIELGRDFQMPFYALGAAQAVLGGQEPPPHCRGWAYYSYRRPVKLSQRVGDSNRFAAPEDYIAAGLKHALAHTQRIRGGQFALEAQNCAFCDFSEICRHADWRIAAKTGGDGDAS